MTDNQLPSHASQIAIEVARILRETGVSTYSRAPRKEWLDVSEAAELLGYSTSRLYHIYGTLGLTPSRPSKRRLLFRRRDIEDLLVRCQARGPGRPRKTCELLPVRREENADPIV
jgi:hypothetical protein